MIKRIQQGGLQVAEQIHQLVADQIAPGTGIEPEHFWSEFEAIWKDLGPENKELLAIRDSFQEKITSWYQELQGDPINPIQYRQFLESIGYLLPEPGDFNVETENVDTELSSQAGPQLVVPVKNARFSLNAANARWGSLYDALYGTDVIPEEGGAEKSSDYNPVRGQKVIAFARQHLDLCAPLDRGSHKDSVSYRVNTGKLIVKLSDGTETELADPDAYLGYSGSADAPAGILIRHNGLHLEIQIDKEHPIGKTDPAGIKDLLVEAAISTIMDCEDSIAAVDAEDKAEVYSNWLGLMKGTLQDSFEKNGKTLQRVLADDRVYTAPDKSELVLHGRSLLFVRNVGHLMTNNAILNEQGEEVPEGIMDAMMTVFAALHDIKGLGRLRNSRAGSVYIVKPKMHGPDEVAFAERLFGRVEEALRLPANTIKMGIMDEERRTSLNLKACIAAARKRVVFINTGFLDRTGDEIHTSMHAGPMVPKGEMKKTAWIQAYEDNNVDVGLLTGMSGKAQIGKGMWAMPDEMAAMLDQKAAHPLSGATTAWVPSPNGATLHSIHYHQVDVFARQQQLTGRQRASQEDLRTVPIMEPTRKLSAAEIQDELDNNAQGLLGYVVRWVEHGVGCSKVPDIRHVGLMEDRATLRISSQHMANWLLHGICTKEQVMDTLKRMASVVDDQNRGDPLYEPMSANFKTSLAFQAACDLVFKGEEQPNGYTEPLLHAYRLKVKQA